MNLFLYGPPGVGKTSVGRLVARRLGREFVDLDDLIVSRSGRSVESWFGEGESAFRAIERALCLELAAGTNRVVALGGGALLDEDVRATLARDAVIVCLDARVATLWARLREGAVRPLVTGPGGRDRLRRLVEQRAGLYAGFVERVQTDGLRPDAVARAVHAIVLPQALYIRRQKQRLLLGYGAGEDLEATLGAHGLTGPMVVVTDENVLRCQGSRIPSAVPRVVIAPGESSKTFDHLQRVVRAFADAGLDRHGTVVAVGGGVVNDLAGFAAAAFMRGVRWVSVPTSLLAMVDASIGGKTGIDLPEGKNLVGAFHPASLVVIDPLVLGTLPAEERRAGMAEVLKHAVIGAPALFRSLERGRPFGGIGQLRAAIEVKRGIVERDPFEHGEREALNLGHTIGHGVEAASGYAVRHGDAVAIGLAGEARLAERIGLARPGLAAHVERALGALALPAGYSHLAPEEVRAAMAADKKKRGTRLRFALPARVGRVVTGVEVAERTLAGVLAGLQLDRAAARRRR